MKKHANSKLIHNMLVIGFLSLAVIILLVSFLTETGTAEDDARVYGTIFDNSTSEPLEDIQIRIYNFDNDAEYFSQSDDEGDYERNITEGNYSLTIVSNSYNPYSINFSLEEGEEHEHDIYLERLKTGVELYSPTPIQIGNAGKELVFEIRVTNTGDAIDCFVLEIINKKAHDDKDFALTLSTTTTRDLDSMEWTTVTLHVMLPKKNTGSEHVIDLQATGDRDNEWWGRATDVINLTVAVNDEDNSGGGGFLPGFEVWAVLGAVSLTVFGRKKD